MASTAAKSSQQAPVEGARSAIIRTVHLPVYSENAYQPLLFSALAKNGVEVTNGGGGGNFFRTAKYTWKADILHFHWLHPYIVRPTAPGTILRGTRFIAEITALKRDGQRIAWTVHNLHNHDNLQPAHERFFTRRFARLADGIIVHSTYAGHAAMQHFRIREPARITVIPHGNYIGNYPPGLERRAARKKIGISDDAITFLLFGRLQAYKGIVGLLDAFAQLDFDANLVIAGTPANRQTEALLRKKCAGLPRVFLHPRYIPDHHVSNYFNACDVAVLPYSDVLTSGAAILAMSFAKPCIAPTLGGLPETFPAGGAFFYSAGIIGELVGAMQKAANQTNQLKTMGKQNYDRALAWSWERVASETKNVYERCLKS